MFKRNTHYSFILFKQNILKYTIRDNFATIHSLTEADTLIAASSRPSSLLPIVYLNQFDLICD